MRRPVSPAVQLSRRAGRVDDVGVDQQHRHDDQHAAHRVRDRQQPRDVDGPGSGRRRSRATVRRRPSHSAPATCPPSSGSSGIEVEHEQREVQRGDQREEDQPPLAHAVGRSGRRRWRPRPANRPTPTTLTGPFGSRSPGAEGRLRDADHLLRDAQDDAGRAAQAGPDHAGHRGDGLALQLVGRGRPRGNPTRSVAAVPVGVVLDVAVGVDRRPVGRRPASSGACAACPSGPDAERHRRAAAGPGSRHAPGPSERERLPVEADEPVARAGARPGRGRRTWVGRRALLRSPARTPAGRTG